MRALVGNTRKVCAMNKLPLHKRAMILSLLVEGSSMRSISRTVCVSINTVTNLLVEAGEACAAYHDETVREVTARRGAVRRDLVVLIREGEERSDRQGDA